MTVTDAHPTDREIPTPPVCPAWCQSDHEGEDQHAPGLLWQRAHYGFPPMPGNPTPEFRVRIARVDAWWSPDTGWLLGHPHLHITHNGQMLAINNSPDADVVMELVGIAMPHLLAAIEWAAALAWPERGQR